MHMIYFVVIAQATIVAENESYIELHVRLSICPAAN